MSSISASVKFTGMAESTAVHYPFWFGGSSSSLAACVTHPMDLSIGFPVPPQADASGHLVKVRLQTQQNGGRKLNMVQTCRHIIGTEGVRGLYRGLSASLARQLTYSTVRFGAYEDLKNRLSSGKKDPGLSTLLVASAAAGFLGGLAGNPADVLNVRMQHDAALPIGQRRSYMHALDGIIRMVREEGVSSTMRGFWPNSTRAALMTSSQLASYDVIKKSIMKFSSMTDNSVTHFTASLAAGFVATTICSPVDVIKTRIMSTSAHHNIVVLLRDTCRTEGIAWAFRGWLPSFMRLGPQTIATFMFLEQHRAIYRRLKGI